MCFLNGLKMDLKELKNSDIPEIRSEILKDQGYKCAICGKEISENDRITLDHQHKNKKSDENGINGDGLVRGVLCADCNSCEGIIWNSTKRFQSARTREDRIKWLEKLIEYYKKEPYPFIHPTEIPKEKTLSKKNFNKLAKLYSEKYPKKKPLEFPKSKKMTKKLKVLFFEFKIESYN